MIVTGSEGGPALPAGPVPARVTVYTPSGTATPAASRPFQVRTWSPPATVPLSVRTTVTSSGARTVAVTVVGSDAEKGSGTVSLRPSPFGVTIGGTSPSTGAGVTTDGAIVSMRNETALVPVLPAASRAVNTTVCVPSPSTTTDGSVIATGSAPSTATVLP